MKIQRWTLTLLLAAGVWRAAGQTAVDLTRQGKLGAGTVLPVRCTVGQMFLKTNAPAGANLYVCTAAPGTWSITGLPALGGDATGTQQSLTVKGIQGRGVSPTAPADQYVLRWNAASGQWEPGPPPSGMPLSSIVANPTVGGPSDLSSFSWTVGHDDVASQPGWSDASAWLLNFNPSSGQQDNDNASKRTFNILKAHMSSPAAGQREGVASQVYGTGVGDIAAFSCLAVGGSQNSGGDEGTNCYRGELADEMDAAPHTLGTIPAQTTCGTGATITQSIAKATAPQEVTVSSSSGCSVGDRVIVARQPSSLSSTEEMVVLTGVRDGTHFTAKFSHDHSTGAGLSPSTKLDVGDANRYGQFRWLRRVGHDYTTGTVSPAVGIGTWTGTGTTWTATSFGGDATLPGLISFDSDTNARQTPGLRAWYLITGVGSGTSLTASDGFSNNYTGLGGSGSYRASCGGVIMGFGPPNSPTDVGRYVYLDTPPSVCGWTAGDTVEQPAAVHNFQLGSSIILRSYAQAGFGSGGGYSVTNIGDVEKGPAFRLTAPPYLYGDPSHPAFRYALQVDAPVENGIAYSSGVRNSLLSVPTYPGYPAPISWGGVSGSNGTAQIYPDTSSGDFMLLTQTGGAQLVNIRNQNQTLKIDTSRITSPRTLYPPDHGGAILTDEDVPIVKLTKALPGAVNSEIHLGSVPNYAARSFYIVLSSGAEVARTYSFSIANNTPPMHQWITVPPASDDAVGIADDFALELDPEGNMTYFRLRQTSGTGTSNVTATIYCYTGYAPSCVFTPSTDSPSAASAPTATLASSVLSQVAGHLATFGTTPSLSGCGSGASLSPNSNDEGGTLTLGSVPGTCLVTFARAYSTWAPKCTVTFQAGVPGPYSLSTTAISVAASGLTGKVDYRCAQ